MLVSDELRNTIKNVGGFPLSDNIVNQLISGGQFLTLSKSEYIIRSGSVDTSMWITAQGVTKAEYFDGKMQRVLGFSGKGTITMSPISFVLGYPAFCGFQTITECEMIKVPKEHVDKLLIESHEFSRWMVGVLMGQFCALELKARMLSEGNATTKFKAIVKRQMKLDKDGFDPDRPDLLTMISSKDLASYLGITQSYLSNIRKAIIEEERNNTTES